MIGQGSVHDGDPAPRTHLPACRRQSLRGALPLHQQRGHARAWTMPPTAKHCENGQHKRGGSRIRLRNSGHPGFLRIIAMIYNGRRPPMGRDCRAKMGAQRMENDMNISPGKGREFDLTGHACVVTGAAQGIGAAEARLPARRGATGLCVDLQDTGPVVDEIRDAGGAALSWHGDVTARGAAEDILAAAAGTGAPVSILVNNAGVVRDRMVFNLDDADWDTVLAVNLTAP